MWFKSLKSFKEDPEHKAIIFATARYTLFTYNDKKDVVNHNEREQFVDAWLAEPKPRFRIAARIDLYQGGRYIFD